MSSPNTCLFTESHEWYRVDGDVATVGISQFATHELTDVTYVEMQPVGTKVSAGDSLGEVESVKTTSDVFAAAAGEIVEVNPLVSDDPSLLNSDPYGDGWLVRVRLTDGIDASTMQDFAAYDQKFSS